MYKQLFLLVLLIIVSCTSNKPGTGMMPELDSLLAKEFSDDQPGGSVMIKKGGKIIFLGNYGLADLGTKEKITENTLFNLGSVSKTFVSNGLLILKERGELTLDDSLSVYFDDFKNRDIAARVKLYHMLSHTSGLPDNRNVSEKPDFYLTAKDRENFDPVKQADSLDFEPGERYEYSNPAFNGLALIIEKVTGKPWQSFIEDNILKPSGMITSKITDGPYPREGVAHAYELADGRYAESDYGEFPTFAASGNGGVWSSVMELAKYEEAIRNNVFLGKELTEESRTVLVPGNWADTIEPFIGYSWFIGEKWLIEGGSNFNQHFVYHTGSQGGFRAFYIVMPEKDILYVGLFNRPPESLDRIIMQGLTLLEEKNWLE